MTNGGFSQFNIQTNQKDRKMFNLSTALLYICYV